jgi:hypothetical protein
MTPRQFFDEVAEPNAQLAIANRGDLRHAVNAIMALDAAFGILHDALKERRHVTEPNDNKWRDELTNKCADYGVVRDTAYAIKHGKLDRPKHKIVRRPDQVHEAQGAFQSNGFSSGFQTHQVWITGLDGTQHRANELIENVIHFTSSQLVAHGL